jgi:hypothetical protein
MNETKQMKINCDINWTVKSVQIKILITEWIEKINK